MRESIRLAAPYRCVPVNPNVRPQKSMANDRDSHSAAVSLFVGVLDLSRSEAIALANEGHTRVEEVAFVPLNELLQVKGILRSRVLQIRERAKKCVLPGQ